MRTQPSATAARPSSRSVRLVTSLALGSLMLLAADTAAQEPRPRPTGEREPHGRYDGHDHEGARGGPRWELGGGFSYVVPQGEFGDFVDDGYGFGVHAVYALDTSGAVGLRFDAAWVRYGSEHFGTPVYPAPCCGWADVGTHNNIGMFGIGPQLKVPSGPIRPYINGFVGLGYFYTETSINDPYYYGPDARYTNFDDTSLAYGGGGGLSMVLGHGRNPLAVDFDVQYRRHDDTEYLVEGSIWDDGFGGVVISPLYGDADFLMFSVGVSIGL